MYSGFFAVAGGGFFHRCAASASTNKTNIKRIRWIVKVGQFDDIPIKVLEYINAPVPVTNPGSVADDDKKNNGDGVNDLKSNEEAVDQDTNDDNPVRAESGKAEGSIVESNPATRQPTDVEKKTRRETILEKIRKREEKRRKKSEKAQQEARLKRILDGNDSDYDTPEKIAAERDAIEARLREIEREIAGGNESEKGTIKKDVVEQDVAEKGAAERDPATTNSTDKEATEKTTETGSTGNSEQV